MSTKEQAVLGVVIVVALTLFVPVLSIAGSLEPPAALAPTMKTLDEIPPTWSQILPADDGPDSCNSSRFKCVLGGAAVLDKETGLVWEKSPGTSTMPWDSAVENCTLKEVGGRAGWHLPTVVQLASLVDRSVSFWSQKLPSGHPFSDVQSSTYWSATTNAFNTAYALSVDFGPGMVRPSDKAINYFVWCVRGGQTYDVR